MPIVIDTTMYENIGFVANSQVITPDTLAIDIPDAICGEPFGSAQDRPVEPWAALRQAQGERKRHYFRENAC